MPRNPFMPSPFTPEEVLRRARIIYPAAAGIGIALGWGLYLSAALFGKDWLDKAPPGELTITVYWYIAIALTIAGAVFIFVSIRKYGTLLRRGVQTEARVVSISSVGEGTARPVTLAYVANGQRITVKLDMPEIFARNFNEQTRLPLMYDPQNPKRFTLLRDQDPSQEQPETRISQTLADVLHKPALLVVYWGTVIVLLLLVHHFGGKTNTWILPIILGSITILGVGDELFQRLLGARNILISDKPRWILIVVFAVGAVTSLAWNIHSADKDAINQKREQADRDSMREQMSEAAAAVSPEQLEILRKIAEQRRNGAAITPEQVQELRRVAAQRPNPVHDPRVRGIGKSSG